LPFVYELARRRPARSGHSLRKDGRRAIGGAWVAPKERRRWVLLPISRR
jgi:hypothetical protein